MEEQDGLVRAYELDGSGGGRPVGWPEVRAWTPENAPLWAHFDREHTRVREYAFGAANLPHGVPEALVAEGSRPRVTPVGSGALIVLRGVNQNPGAEPEDMVSIRIWVEERRLLSFRSERLVSPRLVAQELEQGRGPVSAPEVLVDLVEAMVRDLAPVVETLEEELDAIEEALLEEDTPVERRTLADLRRRAVELRRYLYPQRDALARLAVERIPWLDDGLRARLRELAERTARFVEDIDSCRERAAVAKDELVSRQSDLMNRRLYVLGLVTTIFLPLGLLTGLLGINVGGIPGADDPHAFWYVCGILVVLLALQYYLLRRLRWF